MANVISRVYSKLRLFCLSFRWHEK